LVLHCQVARRIETIHQEPEERGQRVAALPGPHRVQGVVLARAEQAEALLDREAVDQLEAAEAALGEADHKLALQNSRSNRCAIVSKLAFICGTHIEWRDWIKVSSMRYVVCRMDGGD
jgi:hypothetical protein